MHFGAQLLVQVIINGETIDYGELLTQYAALFFLPGMISEQQLSSICL
jgi:hypothetical protein